MKTIKKIKTYSMTSPRTGNPVANQFEIYTPEGKYFQSYRSIIAFVDKFGQIMLDEYYHNYSRTTSKYLTQFLNMNTKERTNAIKNKDIILTNLN
jgi:hypothetical protein